MSEKWRKAFKEIHGKTPSKQDYALAPAHVREELGYQENVLPSIDEEGQTVVQKKSVRLKRPADDEFSPYKPMAKRMALDQAQSPARGQGSSSRALFGTPKRTPTRTSARLPLLASPSVSKQPTPRMAGLRTSPRKTPIRLCVFDTPEKGQPSPLASAVSAMPQSPKTPIRSPRKPLNRAIRIQNISSLLAPTPEKKPPPEEPTFEAEEVPTTSKAKTTRTPAGGEAKVFDPTTGKVLKRPFKPAAAGAPKAKRAPAEKGNFVRINMKKKAFTRGKVSAESKRKLKRKQMWKKRFGGAR